MNNLGKEILGCVVALLITLVISSCFQNFFAGVPAGAFAYMIYKSITKD